MMDGKQQSQKLMDYELMVDVFNRVPADARPGGKYGLIAGFGYAGDYPTKGEVTTPRQYGQQTPQMAERGQLPVYGRGNKRVSGFYIPPGLGPLRESTQKLLQSERLFPMGTPVADEVYYQDVQDPERYFLDPKDTADRTIMHEFYHRGANKLPLEDLAKFSEKKGDRNSALIFRQMQKTAGEHYLLEAVDAYVKAEGDEKKLPSIIKTRLDRIEKANDIIREYMTPKRQKELGLRMPLQETKPKKEGMFDKLLK